MTDIDSQLSLANVSFSSTSRQMQDSNEAPSVRSMIASLLIAAVQFSTCSAEIRQLTNFSDAVTAVHYFCDCALLLDRGVTNTPFMGSADQWVLRQLEESKNVRDYLRISAEQLSSIAERRFVYDGGRRRSKGEPAHTLSIFDHEEALATRERIHANLNDLQQEKLSVIYLNVEGMMALRRHYFRRLIGISPDQQTDITTVSNRYLEGGAGIATAVHVKIFTLRNDQLEELPKLNLQLRKLSAQLDRRIASKLTEEQCMRLSRLLNDALQTTDMIQGPGVGRPWHLKPKLQVDLIEDPCN